ncbi:hypothetical protein [Vibrio sp. R78045]|uniref:hypothetical protein n=1 Tax=Vibrio sp. R78045 TaxID=3093868 RepID=UPI0036F2BDBF
MEYQLSLLEVTYAVFVLPFLGAIIFRSFFMISPKEIHKLQLQQRILHSLENINLVTEYHNIIRREYRRDGKDSAIKAHICLFHSDHHEALKYVENKFERKAAH